MSDPPPLPDPVECVLFDAGDTLLSPSPSFQGRFVQVAAGAGLELEEAQVTAAIAAAVRAAEWPTDWTDPATQRSFWIRFYRQVLADLGHTDGVALAEALFESFSDPAAYKLFADARPALEALAGRGIKLGVVSNFEPWLEQVLALEGAPYGIRSNIVNPDAVFRDSGLWSAEVRRERARAQGIAETELEEFYRKRNLLGVSVFPEDVAEAVLFLASDRSAKTTGCTLTVDGGVRDAFPR